MILSLSLVFCLSGLDTRIMHLHMYRHDSRSFLLGAGVYASSSSSSSRLAQGGAEKPSERRKRAACSAARVLGGSRVPIAVASAAEEGGEYTRLVFAQCADSVRPRSPVGGMP